MHLFTACILLVFLSADFAVASFILAPTRVEGQSPQTKAFPMTPQKKESRRHLDPNKVTGSLLVPSQVLLAHNRCNVRTETAASTTLSRNNPSNPKKKSDSSFSRTALSLVPSQVMQHHSPNFKNLTSGNSKYCSSGSTTTKRKQTRRKLSNRKSSNVSASPIGKQNGRNKSQERRKRSWQGDLPDVEWRAISMDHLRLHPNFVPLPPPSRIGRIDTMEDVRRFRQDSWQWDALHSGRCTTSQVAAALGFLEPIAADTLGVPQSLRRGGLGAYERLRQPRFVTTLEEMNTKLIEVDAENVLPTNFTETPSAANPWIKLDNKKSKPKYDKSKDYRPFPFAAKYRLRISEEELQSKRDAAMDIGYDDDFSVRLRWGSVQEATALLTALNYFWQKDNRVMLEEVGMCGAGLHQLTNNTHAIPPGLVLGASPDALLRHPDGRIEVVEVKNHCPFRKNRKDRSKNGKKRFQLQSFPIETNPGGLVLPHYVSQLMMEMFCMGPDCESAILIRQTATNGALILRIKRDNDWIKEMLYWLARFHDDFVRSGKPPPPNFFWNSTDSAERTRYHQFLERTKQIESNADVLDHIPNRKIQRVVGESSRAMDLFLD